MKQSWRALAFGLPACVLFASYLAICIDTGSAWPWGRIVHESDHRTLLETLLYGRHILRELPVDLLLAFAVAASVRAFTNADRNPRRLRTARVLGFAAASAAAAALVATFVEGGLEAIAQELSQRVTRPGLELAWGAHWRFHWISRLALLLASFALAGAVLGGETRPRLAPFAAVIAGFAGLSLLFGPGPEPFVDPIYLGHQARELFTHALVTLPLAMGVCIFVTGAVPKRRIRGSAASWTCAILAVALGAGLAIGVLAMDSVSQAQSPDPVRVVAVHFFEHGGGYLIVPCLAGWLTGSMPAR